MGANYLFQNSPISNWSESLEKDVLLPVHGSSPAVGVVGKENIVLAVEKTVTDPRSATKILALDNTGIRLAYAGSGRDDSFLVEMVQIDFEDSERFTKKIFQGCFPISPVYVACKVAHVCGQLGCCDCKPYSLLSLIVGFEPSTLLCELWVAHPSGIVRKCQAHAIGRDFELRNEFLRNNYNYQETSAVKLAIRALLEVGESGEKKIEVTLITREHGLKPLEQVEIDAIIAEIEAEKGASEKEDIIDETDKAEKATSEKEAIIGDIEAEKAAFKKEAEIAELKFGKASSKKAPYEKEKIETEKGASEEEAMIVEIEVGKEASEKAPSEKEKIETEKGASEKEAIIGESKAGKEAFEKGPSKAALKKKKRKAKKAAAEAAKKASAAEAADLAEMED